MGEQMETMVLKFDDSRKKVVLALGQGETIRKLQEVAEGGERDGSKDPVWAPPEFDPEYASYMIESSPGVPYSPDLSSLLCVERSLARRREMINSHLPEGCRLLTLSSFPRLGAGGEWSDPQFSTASATSKSGHERSTLPTEVVSDHPRYSAVERGIEGRKGRRIHASIPVYKDEKTPEILDEHSASREPGAIYMDALVFGAGCCCLQVTLQAPSLAHARQLYDAFLPLAPVMLALSAASPAFAGWLADVDARWDVLREIVDDRTAEEEGLAPLEQGYQRLPKSRYDSASSYLGSGPSRASEVEKYNDVPLPLNQEAYEKLRAGGVDELMAQHVAHLMVRDALVLMEERVEGLKEEEGENLEYFENILSTNWQTVRLKPASADGSTGWRLEFRALEAQLTDGENAALCIFLVLLARAVWEFDLEWYVPVGEVDLGMGRATKRDALRKERFSWCTGVGEDTRKGDTCELMTVNEIINGKETTPGLLALVHKYLRAVSCPQRV
ncbi:GCS-domain-containing protein [Dacryopinax primogenitus]|uniref:Glutamate--cysteine ligase n=1 Tax=Dacryopinax primogenitus (strain DJM 731) TaxID=1858805 RepID=M5GFW7_DACPD|nr:GCS-domain-containing protein [Dacryopinax primogenitus]EJU04508.1 GCS-domain-containing protein [Dacryopinax primogenitus]